MSRKASGLKAWVLQRATALYIGVFSLYLLLVMLIAPPDDYAAWRNWFADPLMGIATLVFVLSVLLHAWVGVRDVVIDYVWNTPVRVAVLGLVALTLVVCGLWASQSLILARLL